MLHCRRSGQLRRDAFTNVASAANAAAPPQGLEAVLRVVSIVVCLVLALPGIVLAQGTVVGIPGNILLPNYERVPMGQREALEAGAYLVRSNDALANWYNPAGLVESARTQVSASSNAYEGVSLEILGRQNKTSSLRLAPLGAFFGVVIARPLVDSDRVRYGFSISNPIDWEPGSIHFSPELAPGIGLGLVDDVSLTRTEPALSIGVRMNERLRIGASLAVPITSLKQHQDIVVLAGEPEPGESTRRTFITDGQAYHILGRFGAQFDITPPLGVGIRLESPGLRVSGSSRVQFIEESMSGAGFTSRTFGEDQADFDYELPFSLAAGAAYQFARGAIEADVHYYGESKTYDMYETDTSGREVTSSGTGTTTSPLTFAPTQNSWRDVVNFAVGGNYRLTETVRVHAGVNSDGSPVADPETSLFRQVDLLGFSTGVSLTRRQFSGALGLGYSIGESDPLQAFSDLNGQPVETTLKVQSFRVSFAVTFTFEE